VHIHSQGKPTRHAIRANDFSPSELTPADTSLLGADVHSPACYISLRANDTLLEDGHGSRDGAARLLVSPVGGDSLDLGEELNAGLAVEIAYHTR